jgi:hypothetical protein
MATASHSCDQSRSHHPIGIITTVHLQTTQSPISAHETINSIKKTHFYTPQPCLLGAVLLPTGMHTCVPVHYTGAHACAPVYYTGAHSCAPIHYTGVHHCAPVCFIGTPLRTHVHHTGAPRCAPVQSTDVHW